MTALTLADFLRARYDEREAKARADLASAWAGHMLGLVGWRDAPVHIYNAAQAHAIREAQDVLADVEAKRAIIDWHENWPVLVEARPEVRADSIDALHYTMSRQMAWLTEREYVAQFGSEPPTGPILRLLALPYASHPDYRQEWKP